MFIRRVFNVLVHSECKSFSICCHNGRQLLPQRLAIRLAANQFYSSNVPESRSSEKDSDHEPNETGNSSPQTDAKRVKEFYKQYDITVHGKDVPPPVFHFEECQWPDPIMTALEKEGFDAPTPIQSQGWPIALANRDLVGIAQTGSGKTLCYVLPAFVRIMKAAPERAPKCLVLAPTRELAQQIQEVVRHYRLANSVCLFGGVSRNPQIAMIRRTNPRIVIGTPGRLNDFIESGILQLNSIDYLVLDEADRMLDMGFEPQIRTVIKNLPIERQTLMWSATWPQEIRSLAAEFMTNYVQINVGGTTLVANRNIKQYIEICDPYEKLVRLMNILDRYPQESRGENKILIFAKTKRTAEFLMHKIREQKNRRVLSTHGDKSQAQRDIALTDFRTGNCNILCATDVAARGLDVDDIQVVINYDFPNCTEDYIHRIGRTGRRNNAGTSYTLFTEEDKTHALDLIQVLKDAGQEVNKELSQLASTAVKGKRVWGYEPRRQGSGFNRRPFGGNNRQQFNNSYNDNYNRRDYDKDNFGDERQNYKRELYNKNYSFYSKQDKDEFSI